MSANSGSGGGLLRSMCFTPFGDWERPLSDADALREQLRSGEYPPGAQLPSERELIVRWGVSSRTIRVALDQLRTEGLVVSYQGRGVFVREQTVPSRLST
jgi:DNA-binding GntR family transcriptional regulator